MDDYPAGHVISFVLSPLLIMLPLWTIIPVIFCLLWMLSLVDFLGWRIFRWKT
jgi:heme/copper-type cytochrome/quinol oxidase subunit 4